MAAVSHAAGQRLPRAWPLRSVLTLSLLAFAVVPTLVVGWTMHQSNLKTVDALAHKVVSDVAERVQIDTQNHLGQALTVFNGMLPEQPTPVQADRARLMLDESLQFETLAFALTRMTPNITFVYFGGASGQFLGVTPAAVDSQNQTKVVLQTNGSQERSYYSAGKPGDRSLPISGQKGAYDARARPWYLAAVKAGGRVFTSIYPSRSAKEQLVTTLAQPVYTQGGVVAGVFAIDLYLDRLTELLQQQRISSKGIAFIVDEEGYMVASSTGDALFSERDGKLVRHKPNESLNPVLKQAYQQVLPVLGTTRESSVQRQHYESLSSGGKDSLVTVMRPFGESQGLRWSLVVAAPEGDFTGEVRAAVQRALLVMLAILLAGAALAMLLARRLSHSFARLSQAAAALGRGEVPDAQSRARVAEVRALSCVLRTSGEEIQRSRLEISQQTEALEQANEHLEVRVLERTAQLEASREEAFAAVRAKASFLATMSHEIRTPLNGVVGMTTLLADTPLDTEQRDYLHTMRVSSDQLLGVINDILDFSKIESGKLELEAEPLNLQTTMEEACDMAAPRAREKGLELVADIDTEVPEWVLGDVTRLRQVLLNFINNAVKFTEHGQVVVSAHLHGPTEPGSDAPALIEFRVKDSGIGIPPDKQSALFQSFTQVDTSTTRKYGGTGLGLAICKRLASIMGGDVGVASVLGEGSTFWFTARLSTTPTPDKTQELDHRTASLSGKLALLVDDTELNLRILDKQLKRWGMRTLQFDRAQSALDWLASCASADMPDVILTDMHMPEMDGQTFTEIVRARVPDAHVVLLTSGTMPTGPNAKVFDARLLKPYRQSQLFNALSRISALPVAAGSEQARAAKPAAIAVHAHKRILVADDNAINLKVVLAMLAKLGYSAVTAINGREAADRVSQSLSRQSGELAFAAVLMDVNMPVMDGLESARLIVASHGAASPPIIALTASVLEEDRQRCLDAGMQGFLTKPLRIDELAEALARHAVEMPDATKLGAASARIYLATAGNDAENTRVLMDWDRLEQFKEFDDEAQSMTREIVALFLHDAPERCTGLRAALASSSSAALSQAAHALKGAASNVGAAAISAACSQLEQSCLQGVWPLDAADQVSRVCDLCPPTFAELQRFMKT